MILEEHTNHYGLETEDGLKIKIRKHAIERARERLKMSGTDAEIAKELLIKGIKAFQIGKRIRDNVRSLNGVVFAFKCPRGKGLVRKEGKVNILCLATVYKEESKF